MCVWRMQSLFSLVVVFLATGICWAVPVPIRHSQILISHDSTYVANHPTHQMGPGVGSASLLQCIYLCQNDDYCRTAVFDEPAMSCVLFEECSSFGDMVPYPTRMVISFQLCDDEPESMAFSASQTASVPVFTVMSNLTWMTNLAASASWYPFFVVDRIYVPVQRSINVYEMDSYQLIGTIPIPSTSSFYFIRGDSQGTIVYNQPYDSNIYIYSTKSNTLTTVTSSLTNFNLCFSASFIIITSSPLSVADVYLRTPANNSATFIYRINGWSYIRHCVIQKDQKLVAGLEFGGMQTTMLSKTTFNSTIITLSLNASYLPTGAVLNFDAAGRLYTSTDSSQHKSLAYLSDGRLVGFHPGTLDCAGKASKYKFIFLFTDGNQVTVYEYQPSH